MALSLVLPMLAVSCAGGNPPRRSAPGVRVVDLAAVRNASPIVHAILALILLLAATVLGVYKPFGMTDYGRRKDKEQRQAVSSTTATARTAPHIDADSTPAWIYMAGAVAMALPLLVVILHLTGGSPTHH
jgi:hypothetical protein